MGIYLREENRNGASAEERKKDVKRKKEDRHMQSSTMVRVADFLEESKDNAKSKLEQTLRALDSLMRVQIVIIRLTIPVSSYK